MRRNCRRSVRGGGRVGHGHSPPGRAPRRSRSPKPTFVGPHPQNTREDDPHATVFAAAGRTDNDDAGFAIECRTPSGGRASFDAQAAAGTAAGVTVEHVWRSVDAPDVVFFLLQVEDRARAEAYMASPEASAAGADAGVLDGEVHFVEAFGVPDA